MVKRTESHFFYQTAKDGLVILVKIIHLDNVNPLKIVYRELYELGNDTWCTHVRPLLDTVTLVDVWGTQTRVSKYGTYEIQK